MNFNKSQMKIFIEGIEYDLVPKSSPDKKNKRDWEIIAYTVGFAGLSSVKFIRLDDGSFGVCDYRIPKLEMTMSNQQELESNKAVIHSVKRLSDGVVFSVGEKFSNNHAAIYSEETIESFEIKNEELRVKPIEGGFYLLSHLSKLPERTTKPIPDTSAQNTRRIDFLEERIAYIEKILKIDK